MKRFSTRVSNAISKTKLDQFLLDWLPKVLDQPISRSRLRTLLHQGSVYVNRHRTKDGNMILFSGASVEVYYGDHQERVTQLRTEKTSIRADQIVYEDDALMVLNKPSGIPTQPTVDAARANAYDLLKQHLLAKDKNAYLGLHHRLDKDTSGLILFTKKEIANKGVADLFLNHQIQKTYQCVCWKSPQAQSRQVDEVFFVKNFLGRISEKNEIARFGAVESGGDPAETQFQIVENFREAYWMKAKPKTGRTHQIRVHAAEQGLPILGDPLYFPSGVHLMTSAPRLMLHAARLEFEHPLTKKLIDISAAVPDEFFKFMGELKA